MKETIVRTPLFFNNKVISFNGNLLMFNVLISLNNNDSFFYPHTCAIYRHTGELDDNGLEITKGIYYGICGYDNNSNGSTSFQGISWQTSPSIIIPETDINFEINDVAVINLENERVVKASVKQPEVQLEKEFMGTTLWLKSGNDE